MSSSLATWPLLLIESLLVLVALLWATFYKRRDRSVFPRWFHSLARKKAPSAIAIGILVVLLRSGLIPVLGLPQPEWHDEFSYLLAADTFAHGRVTNPTPPLWTHFETFHVIFQPTYMSMYPPAQGLVLALGQTLGHPWIGQLLMTGGMCAAICWMLQAWLPPSWALLGGLLAALRLGILSYWMNGYWSASVVALSGALLVGAVPRIKRRPSAGLSALLAMSLILLANSRPYEGLVLGAMVAAALFWWYVANPEQLNLKIVLPGLICLVLGATATGYYNYRVTGSATRMAYQVNRSTYGSVPFFLVQRLQNEPSYRHEVMRAFYEKDRRHFEEIRTARGFFRETALRCFEWWNFYLGPLLTIPLLALPGTLRDRRMRFPLSTLAAMACALCVVTWFLPHYFAPATAILYLVLVQGLRHIARWNRPSGPTLVRSVILIALVMVAVRVTSVALHLPLEPKWPRGNLTRAEIASSLDRMTGQQIVIIRYGQNHDPALEWIYNNSDMETAKVVWARDMGENANSELLAHFPKRQAWIVEPDVPPVTLQPYQP